MTKNGEPIDDHGQRGVVMQALRSEIIQLHSMPMTTHLAMTR